MQAFFKYFSILSILLFISNALVAGTAPCSATNYQLSDFGITRTYTLDNGTFNGLPDPICGDYQGQDFWVTFSGPDSGLVNIELLDGSITDAAFEVYWNACNGLATPIGCHSDRQCGTIPMPGASIEVIPGEIYHVRIFQEGGGGGTLGYRMSNLGGAQFDLGGTAEPYDSGNPTQTCFRLTEAQSNELGCAWFNTPIDFASGFELNYQIFFGDNDNGADGIAFIFHRETNPSCSNSGGGLGATGFTDSFILEFDTFNNGPGGVGGFGGDIPQDHIAITLNNTLFPVPIFGPVPVGNGGDIEDGMFHDVRLLWDPVTNFFQVFFDGNLVVNTDISLITSIFGVGNQVFWGVTGSTGGSGNEQIFCFDGFRLENSGSVEVNVDETICDGEFFSFNGQFLNMADEYEAVFRAANGCDSTVTLNLQIAEFDITGVQEITLNCSEDEVSEMLDPNLDTNLDETQLTFSWETLDGSFASGENTLTPTVSAAGTYTLTVESLFLGCEEEFVVEVTEAEPPFVQATGGFLGCSSDGGDSTIVIMCDFGDGFNPEDFDIEWLTANGHFVGPTDIQNPEVDSAGVYTVTITDPITGCTNSSSIEVASGGGIVPASLNTVSFCIGESGPIFLEAELEGNVVGFEWSPVAGLDDPFSLNPEVLDVTQAQEFTLSYKAPTGLNLVPNGSFVLGDTLFNSDYTAGVGASGEYLVTNTPSDFFGSFTDCDDNSDFDDQMMVVDGHTTAGQNIWCQTVDVAPGNQYIFSAFFTNLCNSCSGPSPLISMTIDGVEVTQQLLLDIPDCEWTEVEQIEGFCWTATNPTAELCITNLETASNGNDFAIDDIGLYLLCGGFGVCGIEPFAENIVEIDPVEIACQPDGIVELTASGLSTDPSNVSWSWGASGAGGSVVSGGDNPTTTVQGPGTYSVTLTDNNSGCTSTATIDLMEVDTDFPPYSLDADVITCDSPGAFAGVFGLNDADYSFDWSDGSSGSSIVVGGPGSFTVTITDLANDCTEVRSVEVFEDAQLPDVNIAPIDPLTCNEVGQAITLFGDASSSSTIYAWSTSDGNIISGENSQNAEIMGAGNYILEVFDLNNGCTNLTSITIEENTTAPSVSVGPLNFIDCFNVETQITLDGTGLEYQWSSNPNIISALDGNSISVIDGGAYDVLVTNPLTGCDTTISVTVDADFSEPDVEAGDPQTFTCTSTNLSLSGSSNSNISNIEWQTAGGLIVSGGNTLNPEIGGAGTYTLIITGDNGCTASDMVLIDADEDLPTVAQIPDLFIDCNNSSTVIDATSSSSGPDIDFEWRDGAGNVIPEFTTLNPSVSVAGSYQLFILDTNNGCSAETVINVFDNFADPDGVPTNVSSLNCIDLTSTFGLQTTNPGWTYTWSNSNGVISGENAFQLEAAEEGTYTLLVTDQSNGCDSEYVFDLENNVSMPTLNFAGPTLLSCQDVELEISVTSDATNPSYAWQTSDGNILQANDAAIIRLDNAGTYSVTITDGLTGCTVVDQIVIASDDNAPIIEFPQPDQITCDINEVLLISTVTNIGGDVEFIWTTMDGILASPNGGGNISAGSPGTYTLTIVNNENGCESSNNVIVEESVSTFIIDIDMPGILDCDVTELELNAQDVGPNVEYLWTTMDGSILSGEDGLNPTINQEGEYTLTVTDRDNGCVSSSSISVQQDGDLPNIDILPPTMINCDATEVTIDASGSTQGLDILTVWTTADGNILSGENSLTPTVDSAGEYILTVTNVSNNCELTQLVNIEVDDATPQVDFAPVADINCGNTSVDISSLLVDPSLNVSYEWSTANGSIVGSTNTADIEVDGQGSYVVLVTNLDNMCSESFSVNVDANNEVPDVAINIPDNIDCSNMTSVLTVEFPNSTSNLIFDWNTADGTFDGDPNNSEIIATTAGTYNVTVTDTQSSCETVLTAFVLANGEIPDLEFIQPDIITCDNTQSVINTQTGINGLIYDWSTSDGLITSATNGEDLVVESGGTYTLIVTDPSNNCTNSIVVDVVEDVALPTAEIQPALELNCIIEEQSLSGDGSSMGNEFSYDWTTSMGSIVSGANTLNPLITGPGLYLLEVTNNDNNCVQIDSVLVTESVVQPLATIVEPLGIDCETEIVTLAIDDLPNTDLSFSWSTDNGNIISAPNMSSIDVDMPGVYELMLVDNINGCDNLLFVEVFADQEDPILDLAPGFTLTCDQMDGQLSIENVSPNSEISWFDPAGNVIANATSVNVELPGTYSVVATSLTNSCQTMREVEVMINENMPTDLIADITPPVCFGETGSILLQEVIGGEGPFLYSTDDGQSFGDLSSIENLAPGSINNIIVMDSNGCEFNEDFAIPDVDPVLVDLPLGVELLLGESFELLVETNVAETDIDQIIWTPDTGLTCTDCLNPSVTPNSDIEYQVEIINSNGCSDFAIIQLRVNRDQNVYIPNAFSPFNQDGFNDAFYLFTQPDVVSQVLSLQVYDRWGTQVFFNENFNPNEEAQGWNGRFRDEKMQVGVYVYYAVVEYADGSTELFKGDVSLID